MDDRLKFQAKRCLDFWEGQVSNRPLISFWVGSFSIPDLYPFSMSRLPDGTLTADDIVLEIFRDDYQRLYTNNLGTGSDVPWAAFPIMTIPWLEAILGCTIQKSGNNIWAEPLPGTLEQIPTRRIDLGGNAWLEKLLEFTQWLIDFSAGRFPVSAALMRGPSDLLSAMRGSTQMCLDIIDRPDAVKKIMGDLAEFWIKVAQQQIDLIPPFDGGYSFGQIYLWGREKGAWFQDDAVALLSPKHFKQFLFPFEKRIASALPKSGIHLHPRTLFVVDDLLDIADLGVIEVNYEPYGVTLKDMLPYLIKAVRRKRVVLWGDFNEQDLIFLKENLPAQNLCLQMNVGSAEKARSAMALVNSIWGMGN
jgi:hypothetical protein